MKIKLSVFRANDLDEILTLFYETIYEVVVVLWLNFVMKKGQDGCSS